MDVITPLTLLSALLILLHQVNCDGNFTIDTELDRMVEIIEKSRIPLVTSRVDLLLAPQHLNYLVPFDVELSCEVGGALVRNVSRMHSKNVFTETNDEALVRTDFTVSKIEFNYRNCSLFIMIPVPFSLQGLILNSSFTVFSRLVYKPKCKMTIQTTAFSYEKLEFDLFKWFPGYFGDFVTSVLTQNVEDRIYEMVKITVQNTIQRMSLLYNPCRAFLQTGYSNG